MPAGREMDALITEKVLKRVPCDKWEHYHVLNNAYIKRDCGHERCYPRNNAPNHSSDIAAAWEVVQWFVARRKRPSLARVAENEWRVALDDFKKNALAYADTAPLAICRAALLAAECE